MAIKPFRAWRPAKDKVHLVASRSYVSYTPAQLRRKLDENPFTFLHIIHPDGTAKLLRSEVDTRFKKVRERFNEFCDEEILQREEQAAFYVYEQITPSRSSIGVVAGVPVTDYHEERIKKHEQTLTVREALFARYLKITGINAEPVLLSTKEPLLTQVLRSCVKDVLPHYDFTTTNRHRHVVWAITDKKTISKITKAVGEQELYIADGHHRSASSALVAGNQPGPADHFMAMIVDSESLHIRNYDRAVKNMNGKTVIQLIKALEGSCKVKEVTAKADPKAGSVIMLTPTKRYRITFPKSKVRSAAAGTEAALLSEYLLEPILGMQDLRTEKRIQFIPGDGTPRKLDLLLDHEKVEIAFWLPPVRFEQLTAVADENGIMPPKSTYIEPKLRSGLTIYSLNDE